VDPTAALRVYALSGERIHSLDDFWTVIGEAINGPGGYFGRNLDAFADCLGGGFGTPEQGYVIRWLDAGCSRHALGYPETVRQLEKRLASSHPANRERVADELRAARQLRGPTVFDWLIEIIRSRPAVRLELC
jgi:RNAse (barnase) inhibitor barstar